MSKTLIAYYSWSGTTKRLAERIHKLLPDSTLLELTVAPGIFSRDMYKTADIAKQQMRAGELPQLTNQLPDLTDYDLVLVGGPVWTYSPSTPVLSFLHALGDYAGKVAPFYTSVGNNGDYERQFADENPQLRVLTGNDNGKNLKNWLEELEEE
ncbi:flavodoxin [Limosilactobacillus sp.]|uniref:flavodoxin n=1 Tax=Limosilactobacillus sp. TaxID=2773925 RepID=UPI0025C543D1|nr:flavodoxin [Limosilactobacillus sp.]MCH3921613.1 flavodoxin [Limosilactobacillus sp.]MCH3928384.1 flavodoxin [Limosilactobacillus sp.]